MEIGTIVEFIDHEKIICAVVMEIKKMRLRLLTENNREVKLTANRLTHKGADRLDLSMGRDRLVSALKKTALKRRALINDIDIKQLWEVLNTEQEWIDLPTMTEFCFINEHGSDRESAVVRAFFNDRIYFKFSPDRFFPNSEERVAQILAQAAEAARKQKICKIGAEWLQMLAADAPLAPTDDLSEEKIQIIEILKSIYLFEKESPHYELGKAILKEAGFKDTEQISTILARLGVWGENENIDLYRFKIAVSFTESVNERAADLVVGSADIEKSILKSNQHKDLTDLSLMTIDGQSTLDFDDAISIEEKNDHYRMGVHITDVGYFIKKGDLLDQEAMSRASAIYMPDQKIPMLPACLTDDLCSLKADELRPAISILIDLDRFSEIIDYEIVASIVKVKRQLTYYDVNNIADEDPDIIILHDIAKNFRNRRLKQGALQITLPEISVWVDKNGDPVVNRINRESPGRMLVAEIMIMANWLMGKFLAAHESPAIYRSQPAPKERLYRNSEGSLFQNWMQRKRISRFVLNSEPEFHSGLGLETYVTATSPIRKCFDLVTQRQIRAILGLEAPYSQEEIDQTIQMLQAPMGDVIKMQYRRNRYWLLKHLEKMTGCKEEAIVLAKQRNNLRVLLPEYMIECNLPPTSGIDLNPEDLVQVTIQHVNARRDVLTVFLG